MAQTAVEWFFKWFNDNQEATHKQYAKAFEQAKAMEKEQIEKALERGFDEGCEYPEDRTLNDAEQYYNETYNK